MLFLMSFYDANKKPAGAGSGPDGNLAYKL